MKRPWFVIFASGVGMILCATDREIKDGFHARGGRIIDALALDCAPLAQMAETRDGLQELAKHLSIFLDWPDQGQQPAAPAKDTA